MKNVLNCRENEAFVLILWPRQTVKSTPPRREMRRRRDETVSKKEEEKM